MPQPFKNEPSRMPCNDLPVRLPVMLPLKPECHGHSRKPVQPKNVCWDDPRTPPDWSPISPAKSRKFPSTDSGFARLLGAQFEEEARNKEEKEHFTCQICFMDQKLDEGVNLDCGHITCNECFGAYIEVKIREKCVTVQEMVCPMPKCFCPITEHQVMGSVQGTPLLDRFLDTRAELYRPDNPIEKHCRCPCGEAIIVESARSEGFIKCPTCKEEVCYKCQERHAGVPCAEFWQWRKENDKAQQAFEELMSEQGWKSCPVCQAPTEKSFGCNYMTCASATCRGCTHFCYICGDKLTHMEHFLHFPDGLFRDACQNKRFEGDESSPDFWMQLWRMFQGVRG
ncbi:unnamed protein product [Polarella glacialis]|uniref:RING-type domain-containing protein n=1 Tax=Polarella glacialis TaxID=89957 RepID=A0A813HYB5_POLGL|nr:unnamed protein product [Polarella glacialis]